MSYQERNTIAQGRTQVVDQGLQSYMRKIYNTMGLGLVVTGATAYGIAHSGLFPLIFGNQIMAYAVMFSPLVFLLFGFTPSRIARMQTGTLAMLFAVFAALMGVSMSTIFMAFTEESIARVFFITAATFGAMSIYGYTTKRDLAKVGSFLVMGMIGIFFAALINIFMASEAVHFAISVLGVVIFTGLTAWDTQRLKESYSYGHGSEEANGKLAVMGALSLYLNFVNLFQMLLNLAGNRE